MSLRAQRLAVAAYFLLSGFGYASAYTRLPDIKRDFGLTDAALGFVLLGPAVGALIAMPIVGVLIPRVGSRVLTVLGATAYAVLLGALGLAGSLPVLVGVFAAIGAALAALDVSMNEQAARVEIAYGRPIMSSFHGLFSLGALAGAGAGGLFAAWSPDVTPHFLFLALATGATGLAAAGWLRPHRVDRPRDGSARGRPNVAALAPLCVIAFCCLLGEGAVADWSAIYLRDHLGAGPALAATGFAAFSLTMTLGRLLGDRVTARVGPRWVVGGGGLVVGAGLTAGLIAGTTWGGIVGFGLVGLGLSCMVPVIFTAAAGAGEPGPSIAAVSTIGYTGFIVGPPLIGILAEEVGMRPALGVIAALGFLAAAIAPAVRDARAPARRAAGSLDR